MNIKALYCLVQIFWVSNQIAFAVEETEVTEYYTKVYIAPATNTKCIGFGQKGDRFQILGETDRWYRIQFKDSPGWLLKSQSRKYSSNNTVPVLNQIVSSIDQAEVTEDYSKVYLAPAANTKCIGFGQKGDRFQILGETDRWYRIQFKDSPGWLLKSQSRRFNPDAVTVQSQKSPVESGSDSIRQVITSVNKSDSQSNTPKQPGNSTFQLTPQQMRSSPETSQSSSSVKRFKESVEFTRGTEFDKKRVQHNREWFSRQSFHKILPPSGLPQENELMNNIGVESYWVKMVIYGSIILIIIILIIISSVIFRKNMNSTGVKKNLKKMNILIVSKSNKEIESTLTDSTITLDRCFSELGFHVTIAQNLLTVRKVLDNGIPDILFIDWQFGKDIIPGIEQLFRNISDVYKITVFVFDHPDPSNACQGSLFQTIFFLGIAFSDTDIFKLITPVIISANSGMNVQKSVQSSALEGKISQTNLIEVLQFIDIGHKTGCMLIECGDPFAILYFYQGRIIYAQAQESTGKDAVFRVLNLNEGKFRFLQNKLPETSNVNLSTLEILMEWTKELDEASVH
jgi:hypothetical protein